jgi:S-adenosylmethionine hydrolase
LPKTLPISFLSDYGHDDELVGVCHGVMQGIAPGATIIDLAHGLPRHEVRPAAIVLRNALRFMPPGVHVAIVDPGVGTDRRPVALRLIGGRFLVGPDNGLLAPAAEVLGGVETAVDLSTSPFRLEPVSATFHGRDLFAPVAARLALGTPIAETGELFAPDELARLSLPQPDVRRGEVLAHVAYIDRFGNVALDAGAGEMAAAGYDVGERITIERGGNRHEASYVHTFADVAPGALLAYEDSYGAIAVAVNRGSAAGQLGVGLDDELRLRRADDPG